ncbi:uncharacterized protein [Lolium perenne]|uniref:uncharacterized protein n=1 Tax=Lolium perenne TaxID=4522 RepID=UPI0021F53B89|nr:uncharacterized protein LOC127328171 [Lolium perenne]
MGALNLPPGVLEAFDLCRRAFFWAATDRVSGAQCLIAWSQVKLLHRLHIAAETSWPAWVWSPLGGNSLAAERSVALCGPHWSALRRLLPLYRSISAVSLGDVSATSFWIDVWLPMGELSVAFPHLLSFFATPEATRALLLAALSAVSCTTLPDARSLVRCAAPHGRLRVVELYKLRTFGGVQCPFFEFVWLNHAPPRVRVFTWLLVQHRLPSRANLLRKTILTEEESSCPLCGEVIETCSHLVFGCPFARSFWDSIGASPPPRLLASDAALVSLPGDIPASTSSSFRPLCLWHLWKHWNGVVFQNLAPSLALVRKCCRDDALLWRCRLPLDRRDDVLSWVSLLGAHGGWIAPRLSPPPSCI